MKLNKIAVIMQSPDFGGAESFMISLIEEFKNKKVEVTLFSNKGKYYKKAKESDIKVKELPFILDFMGNKRGLIKFFIFSPYYFFYYYKLIKKIKKENFQVILMSGFSEKLVVSLMSIIIKIPVVWIEYGPLKYVFKRNFRFPEFMYKSLSKIPSKIIVPTNYTKKDLLFTAKIDKSKLEVIPCGIKTSKRKRSRKDTIFTIGSVSRVTKEKGQDQLIKAAALIKNKIPNFRVLIVGGGPDIDEFKALAKELNVDQNVVFTGFVKDTTDYYSEFDVFAFTSVWEMEGFGLVSIEAMLSKVPVVAFKNGPVENIIEDRKNGLLVKSKNASDLSEAILLLYKNKKLKEKIISNAYNDVLEKYDIKVVAKQYLSILQNAI